MLTRIRLFPLILAALAAGCGSSNTGSPSSLAPIHGHYSPSVDPADFVDRIDNRYWPLEPGTTFHYTGMRGSTLQTDDELVTHQKKRIFGISCTVVRDTVSEHGRAIERTLDFYAQD